MFYSESAFYCFLKNIRKHFKTARAHRDSCTRRVYKRETYFDKQIVFCEKISKSGFNNFPENTIERLGFYRFFSKSRDKSDVANGWRYLFAEKGAKTGRMGPQIRGKDVVQGGTM